MTNRVSKHVIPLGRPARVGVVGLGRIFDLTVRGYLDNDDAQIVDALALRSAIVRDPVV